MVKVKEGPADYRYLKTVIGDELVHVIVAEDHGGLSGFTGFVDDLTDAERSGGTIMIDLSSVTVLETHLLDAVQRASRRVRMRGDRFVLVCPSKQLRRLFELTGMDRQVPIHNSVLEALTAVRAEKNQ